MATEIGPFLIRKPYSIEFLHTAIDSGGMDVFWVGMALADQYQTRKEAEDFITRVKERYPNEKLEVMPYDIVD